MADMENRRSARRAGTGTPTFDLPDRKILSAIRADGRLTVNELAAKVGLSQSACGADGSEDFGASPDPTE